ncbi:MAG: 30S ribosomal protein S8 [Acidobacteriota bacterium]|nr:30S ribosomal protein S8 [Acidobacteriota bacterium]MDQ7088431.1 30S ribosomal protein S8 [Acidobacteriota bacterium]
MSMTDPIADMLTRIRNALMAEHRTVVLPSSRIKREIAQILKSEGYISDFRHEDDGAQGVLHVELKYGPEGERVISGLRRISRPGRRVYIGRKEIPDVLGGMGITILSTSKGVLDGRSARQHGVGGERLCDVW